MAGWCLGIGLILKELSSVSAATLILTGTKPTSSPLKKLFVLFLSLSAPSLIRSRTSAASRLSKPLAGCDCIENWYYYSSRSIKVKIKLTLFPLTGVKSGFELFDVRLLLLFVEHSVFRARLSTMVARSLVTVVSGLGWRTTESSPVEFAPPSPVTATTASARATDKTLSAIDSAACCKVKQGIVRDHTF